jgi:hypothetical protein
MATQEVPLCDCHGQPMQWNKDHRLKRGGGWRCRVKYLAAQRRHDRKRYYSDEPQHRLWYMKSVLTRRRYMALLRKRKREELSGSLSREG